MAGVNETGRRIALILIFGMLPSFAVGTTAFAQSGSAGGTIGKQDKSVSGEEGSGAEAQRKIQPRKRSAPRRETESRSRRGGGDGDVAKYEGTWTVVLSPTCSSAGTSITVTVAAGRIATLGLSGTISPTGTFQTVAADGTVSNGRATSNAGSGTYKRTDGCTGAIHGFKN
jgi:hypothetical protein